jgi:hypothetical protein
LKIIFKKKGRSQFTFIKGLSRVGKEPMKLSLKINETCVNKAETIQQLGSSKQVSNQYSTHSDI